jgi:pyrimidine-nucleoside phosphorylase
MRTKPRFIVPRYLRKKSKNGENTPLSVTITSLFSHQEKAMRAVDIIIKKREKQELTREEIEFFIQGFSSGEIPDYQASAWAMAVLLNGMTPRETADLTLAMARSGETLDLSDTVDIAVDKHSSGGVGDKTTLVVLPVVAACGLPVGKMSGRGLGFSGGTLDKMESIPGYRVNLTTEEFKRQLAAIGIVLTGQSADLAPADGKLYALRDVTGTVPSIPLIASSIMSKKIAAGAQAIVLDVKLGLGAFMQTLDDARELASLMVSIGKMAGREVVALLSDMNQPLGYAVGNALEVREAIETLHGKGPKDFREHCLHVSAQMLILGHRAENEAAARQMAEAALSDERAFQKFRELVEAQGGDVSYIDHPEKLPRAKLIETVPAPRNGFIAEIHARIVGETAVLLGAGRARKGDPINHAVGILIHHKVGEKIEKGEPLFTLHAENSSALEEAKRRLLAAHRIEDTPAKPLPLFYS